MIGGIVAVMATLLVASMLNSTHPHTFLFKSNSFEWQLHAPEQLEPSLVQYDRSCFNVSLSYLPDGDGS